MDNSITSKKLAAEAEGLFSEMMANISSSDTSTDLMIKAETLRPKAPVELDDPEVLTISIQDDVNVMLITVKRNDSYGVYGIDLRDMMPMGWITTNFSEVADIELAGAAESAARHAVMIYLIETVSTLITEYAADPDDALTFIADKYAKLSFAPAE